jgi:hypothetical protein
VSRVQLSDQPRRHIEFGDDRKGSSRQRSKDADRKTLNGTAETDPLADCSKQYIADEKSNADRCFMFFVQQGNWSLGAASCSFEQRQVLDRIASQLVLVYGEPDSEPLPDCLKALVARLEAGEPSARGAEEDLLTGDLV